MGWTFYNSSGQQLKNTGATAITYLDIDGATDIGAAIVDADLFIVDDGAGGTNRKTAASRIATYIGSAITREGGQTTEATSTSTSVADLITAASLTIAATESFTLYGIGRKTAGHASGAGFSLKLNSTSVAVPTASPGSTYSANVLGGHSATQRAEGTSAYLNVQATVTDYVFGGGFGLFVFNLASGGQGSLTSTCTENDPRPTAEITDVIGTVIVGNSSNTAGYDELQVYSNAAS